MSDTKVIENPFKTHGAISWGELMTTDPEGAVSFYSNLLGWESHVMNMGEGDYHVNTVEGANFSGIMKKPDHLENMPPYWGVYMTVNDIQETLSKVESLGGKILSELITAPGVGQMAVIQDPQGAAFSIIQYENTSSDPC